MSSTSCTGTNSTLTSNASLGTSKPSHACDTASDNAQFSGSEDLQPEDLISSALLEQLNDQAIQKLMARLRNALSGPEFTVFPNLPAELRLKIWKEVAHHPRLIELESWSGDDGESDAGMDHGFDSQYSWTKHRATRVASYSRMPPAILETCHESRREAKKFYAMVNFGRGLDLKEQGHTYFNPESDIIYFGQNSCITTLLHFCLDGARRVDHGDEVTAAFDAGQQDAHATVSNVKDDRLDTPRVALRMKPKKGSPWLEGKRGNRGKCCVAIWHSYTYYIDAPHDELHLLKILHGRNAISRSEPEYDDSYEYPGIPYEGCDGLPGCRGLKKVYLVVEPRASDIDPDVVDECVGLQQIDRYISPSEHANEDMQDVELIIAEIDHEEALEGVGPNRWTGDKKPSLEFMELSTRSTSAKAHEIVFMRINSEEAFYYVLTQVQQVEDCKIGIYPGHWQGEGDYAFAFHGRIERVETGKWMLECIHLGGVATTMREIDELDAEFPVKRGINEYWRKDESLYKDTEMGKECSPPWSTA